MCGLVGYARLEGVPRPIVDAFARGTEALRHRGPDGQDVWVAPSGRCVLGHTRLAVIDLNTGDQPMHSADGRLHIAYNGEIYNYRELRDELRAAGAEFRTQSDTEVILEAFRHWGNDAAHRLNGMFAVAIWDEDEARLTLLRDRSGQKPLFVAATPQGVSWASEPKALRAIPGLEPTFDPSVVPEYLAFGYVPTPRTFYHDLVKLPPGSIATFDAKGYRVERYWRPAFRSGELDGPRMREELAEHVQAAVERRLVSDVELGAFLSGGIDSAVVVGLMARLMDRPVKTFSIGFEDQPLFDETSFARISADAFGADHTEYIVPPGAVELVDELVRAYDEPFGDSSALPTYIVSQLARSEVTVALTGDGGDELFAGYPRMKAAQLAARLPRSAATLGRVVSRALPASDDFRSLPNRIRRFFDSAEGTEAERSLGWMPLFGGRLDAILRPESMPTDADAMLRSIAEPLERHAGESALSRTLAMNFETYLLDDLLVKADRSSMAHGLELRAPFLDPELIEFAARLPDRERIRGKTQKVALREAFDSLIPPEIQNRPKWGFGVPLPEWLRTHWRPLLEDRLLADDARVRDWLRPDAVRSLAQRHFDGADESHRLWTLLTLESWLRLQSAGAPA